MEKILLHMCCGPCGIGSIPQIENKDVLLYFANSNIDTNKEFEKRYAEAVKVANYYGYKILKEEYDHSRWSSFIKGLENEPEKGKRCLKCFEFSFILAAKKSIELGYSSFTSTLTISPHKNSRAIFEIGEKVAREFGLEFVKIDFGKNDGFRLSVELSKKLNLYRQKYCGCEYSIWWKK